MKLKVWYWAGGIALLVAAPAWANYSWGQMGQFRAGIQLGIVVLVLLTEILVVKALLRMAWWVTGLAVVVANAASGLLGSVFLGGASNFTSLPTLLCLSIPSMLIEFLVVGQLAPVHSRRADFRFRRQWAFIAVLLANPLSAFVTYGYVYANYRGHEQPMQTVERSRLRSAGRQLVVAYEAGGREAALAAVPKLLQKAQPPRLVDVAAGWTPWAQLRWAARYEFALPEKLDPAGQRRPVVWTGAPYLDGKRGVVFSDGSYGEMSEGEFQTLGAVPSLP